MTNLGHFKRFLWKVEESKIHGLSTSTSSKYASSLCLKVEQKIFFPRFCQALYTEVLLLKHHALKVEQVSENIKQM